MRKKLFLILFTFSLITFSQEGNTKQFSVKSDNDLYSSLTNDRYYTNGLFISYEKLSNKYYKKAIKRIYKISIGQQLYSPFKAGVFSLREHDRPFAGYLFSQFGFTNFYKNNNLLELNTQIGIIGPSALGSETMEFVHNLYGLETATGWKYQISNAFALNFGGKYIKNLSTISNETFGIDWLSSANIGTVFTNLSTGLNLRIGLKPLKKIINSIAYNGNLSKETQKNKEFFFHVKPLVHYTIYDATIQGSFLNNNNVITYDIKPIVFTTEIGISYAMNRTNIGYSLTYHSKKLKSERVPKTNRYGTIFINYAFN